MINCKIKIFITKPYPSLKKNKLFWGFQLKLPLRGKRKYWWDNFQGTRLLWCGMCLGGL